MDPFHLSRQVASLGGPCETDSLRSNTPQVVAMTPSLKTARALALYWGVFPEALSRLPTDSFDDLLRRACRFDYCTVEAHAVVGDTCCLV